MLYLVEFEKWDYDQYDGFVVRVKNKNAAIRLIEKTYPPSRSFGPVDYSGGYTVTEIRETGDDEIILESFNAG